MIAVEARPRARERKTVRKVVAGMAVVLFVSLASMVRRDVPVSALLEKYTNGASRFVALEGMRVHYRDEGQGPALVLLHGTSSSLHTWDGWVKQLAGGRRIIRLDLPGYGLTGPAPDADYLPARHARVVRELLDTLQIARADLAGNSLGGRVALSFCLAYPERVRRLVLIDASGLRGQKPTAVYRLAKTPLLNHLYRWLTPRFMVRRTVEEVYANAALIDEATLDRYQDLTLRAGNRQAAIDRYTGPTPAELDARLSEIHVPTLLQWGEQDHWIPLPFARRMQRGIAGAKLIVYPGVGHVPMEELPVLTARDAETFLANP